MKPKHQPACASGPEVFHALEMEMEMEMDWEIEMELD